MSTTLKFEVDVDLNAYWKNLSPELRRMITKEISKIVSGGNSGVRLESTTSKKKALVSKKKWDGKAPGDTILIRTEKNPGKGHPYNILIHALQGWKPGEQMLKEDVTEATRNWLKHTGMSRAEAHNRSAAIMGQMAAADYFRMDS